MSWNCVYDRSSDEVELEPRKWPFVEKVGVTGETMSEEEEFVVKEEYGNSSSIWFVSIFLRSSTSCGSSSGLSLDDMARGYDGRARLPRRHNEEVEGRKNGLLFEGSGSVVW